MYINKDVILYVLYICANVHRCMFLVVLSFLFLSACMSFFLIDCFDCVGLGWVSDSITLSSPIPCYRLLGRVLLQ